MRVPKSRGGYRMFRTVRIDRPEPVDVASVTGNTQNPSPMKHVVITGASRGLGRAMTMGFATDGWTVSGCGTDAAALLSLAQALGPDHHVQPCDVTDPAAVEEFATAVTNRFGAPDLLQRGQHGI